MKQCSHEIKFNSHYAVSLLDNVFVSAKKFNKMFLLVNSTVNNFC